MSDDPTAPAVPATTTVTVTVTPAHTQATTLHLLEFFPSHEPRTSDPHYHYFNAARKRLEAAGKLVCWICGRDGAAAGVPIELHHDKVEFALANGVDIARFEELFPEFGVTTDEEFYEFVESPANLTALCKEHHTGIHGIHVIPMPAWGVQRYWRKELPPPGTIVTSAGVTP